MFQAGFPMGDCDPVCSYAMQRFLECDVAVGCERECIEENQDVRDACPGWNFYR
jgi:hypothetical protein